MEKPHARVSVSDNEPGRKSLSFRRGSSVRQERIETQCGERLLESAEPKNWGKHRQQEHGRHLDAGGMALGQGTSQAQMSPDRTVVVEASVKSVANRKRGGGQEKQRQNPCHYRLESGAGTECSVCGAHVYRRNQAQRRERRKALCILAFWVR